MWVLVKNRQAYSGSARTPLQFRLDGYPGDEDNGQTSAWYVLSALGFYPVCPASGEYALCKPMFHM